MPRSVIGRRISGSFTRCSASTDLRRERMFSQSSARAWARPSLPVQLGVRACAPWSRREGGHPRLRVGTCARDVAGVIAHDGFGQSCRDSGERASLLQLGQDGAQLARSSERR